MARTLEIGSLPSGMTLTVDVTPFTSDVLTENISLTESATRKTVYTGTIATASGSEYRLAYKSGASYIGGGMAYIGSTDGLTFHARDGVNASQWNGLTTVALPLIPTTAGRTLDVSATGEAGVDWANVGSPTTTVGLTGTTVSTTQVVASVTARVTANSDQIAGSATAATVISAINAALKTGTVDTSTFSPTTTAFETSLTQNSDEYTNQAILWTSGTNAGLTSRIVTYAFANSKDKFTAGTALPNTPVSGEAFVILGRLE